MNPETGFGLQNTAIPPDQSSSEIPKTIMMLSDFCIFCFMACEIDSVPMNLHQSGGPGSYLVRGYREDSSKQTPRHRRRTNLSDLFLGAGGPKLGFWNVWFGGIVSPESYQN